MISSWSTDILGPPFEQCTLDLGTDDEGPVVATLVRALPPVWRRFARPMANVDVLYVHGWSDYFFQTTMARFFTDRGARFYALDLRKYGRSIREGQSRGYVTSLNEYDADIDAALRVIGHAPGTRSGRRLMLLGHSTGGLTLTLWAARHPGVASALMLNSPWLEFQASRIGREALAPLIGLGARLDPRAQYPVVDLGFYSRAQREVGAIPVAGYRDDWRPSTGFVARQAWLAAILEGHNRVARGVDVGCPALVLLSARSAMPFNWSPDMLAADSVLVVDDIARAATRIARTATIARIDGACTTSSSPQPSPAPRPTRRWNAG